MKNVGKFILGAGTIALLGLVVLWGARIFNPEYQAERALMEAERQYAEDEYGGDTPEETLRLFIEALKKEDTDLAAKYFIVDEQEYWKNELLKIKAGGLLENMVEDLTMTSLKINDDTAFFIVANEDEFESQLVMYKNPKNNRWKITEL